jgi:hypothetical protein
MWTLSPSLQWIQESHLSCECIIESWPCIFIFDDHKGPLSKTMVTRWKKLGFYTTGKLLAAEECNGAVTQRRFMVARSRTVLQWSNKTNLPPRPMANAFRPCYIPRRAYLRNQNASAPRAGTDPAPSIPGSRIWTSKGLRQILSDELARAMKCPKTWLAWYIHGKAVTLPSGFSNAVLHNTSTNTTGS